MTTSTDAKQENINLCLRQNAKQKIGHASKFNGKKGGQLLRSNALPSAEKTNHEHGVITLNKKDSEAFVNALVNPVPYNNALKKALKKHDKLVKSL